MFLLVYLMRWRYSARSDFWFKSLIISMFRSAAAGATILVIFGELVPFS